jgi:hypothetical protein
MGWMVDLMPLPPNSREWPVWTSAGNLPASGFYPQTVRPVSSRNTDYALSATLRLRWVAIYSRLKFLKNVPLFVIHRASKSRHGEYCIIIFDALHDKMLLIFGANLWLSPRGKNKGVYSSEIFEKLYQNTGNYTLYDNIIQSQHYDELVFNTF